LREEFIEINDIIEWQQLQIQNGEQKSLWSDLWLWLSFCTNPDCVFFVLLHSLCKSLQGIEANTKIYNAKKIVKYFIKISLYTNIKHYFPLTPNKIQIKIWSQILSDINLIRLTKDKIS
jgi:hypothetical protein